MSKIFANYIAAWSKGLDFQTRSRRSEYWQAYLGYMIIAFVYAFAIGIVTAVGATIGIDMSLFVSIAPFIVSIGGLPFIALGVRRLHDLGITGWLYLISLTGVGSIVLIILFCMDSKPGSNQYGANPKDNY